MYCYTYKASKTTTGVLDKTEKHENPDRLASRGTIYSECAHSREWYGHLLVEKDCDNNMPRGEDCVASQKMIVMKFYLYSKNKRKSKSQPTSHFCLEPRVHGRTCQINFKLWQELHTVFRVCPQRERHGHLLVKKLLEKMSRGDDWSF